MSSISCGNCISTSRWRPPPRPSRLSLSPSASSASSSTSASSSSSSDREHPTFPRVGVAAVLFRNPPARNDATEAEAAAAEEPSLLLIRRAKPPNHGFWSFPGGALELGEGLVSGAQRELREEVPGLEFEGDEGVAGELAGGVAFAAADSIHFDGDDGDGDELDDGGEEGKVEGKDKEERRRRKRTQNRRRPRFHWAIVEVAAVAKAAAGFPALPPSPPSPSSSSSSNSESPPPPPPETASDALASRWVSLPELRRLEEEQGEGDRVTPGCARVAEEAVRRFWGRRERVER